MVDISVSNSKHGSVVLDIGESGVKGSPLFPPPASPIKERESDMIFSVPFMQKMMAELVGTYYLIFAGCAAIAANAQHNNAVTLVGIALVWGAIVMVLVYSLGHVSAHFNPAVTIAFASCKRLPIKLVPMYLAAQLLGSTLASATLRLIFDLNTEVCSKKHDMFIGSSPSGSVLQAFVMEFIITCFLMFVVSIMAMDDRTIEQLAGLVIGGTVVLNVLFAAEVSGASMNPARSLGPALVWSCYKNIWIYIVSPTLGAVSGAWIHNLLRNADSSSKLTDKTNSISNKIHADTP